MINIVKKLVRPCPNAIKQRKSDVEEIRRLEKEFNKKIINP